MPFLLIRNDITRVAADAIVNPANRDLQEGRGTSRAIYVAAGEVRLQKACRKIGHCDWGEAVMTKGFKLPARYIIHAVGPVWQGGEKGEDQILYRAYQSSMNLAKKRRLKSIAFPLLSSGSYGYPKERALEVAVSAIRDFLLENHMTVYLVLYDSQSLAVSKTYFASIEEYIDEHYVEENNEAFPNQEKTVSYEVSALYSARPQSPPELQSQPKPQSSPCFPQSSVSARDRTIQLDNIMLHMGETFSQMLIRLIDERGLTDPQVYHKANIDRKLFSKIRTNIHYSPNKKTAMAFAIALELSLDESEDLLRTAGYSFSESSRFDVIIRYFLENHIYDIFEINEMLFYYGQPVLGG